MNGRADETHAVYDPEPDIAKAVIDAYYSRGVAAADRARDRAERGYTIASAIAAALVAAGAFAKLGDKAAEVQVLGLGALVMWLVAALLFIWVVSVPARTGRDPDTDSTDAFMTMVASGVAEELAIIRKRQAAAVVATIVAVLLTVLALTFATTESGNHAPERAQLELTPKADTALRALCGPQVGQVYATVDPDKLGGEFVPIEMPAGECGTGGATAELPKGSILATRKVSKFPGFPR